MPRRTNPDRCELLALALASGDSVADWARKNDVDPRAAYRWAAKPEVRARVAEIRSRMIDEAVGRLADAASRAVDTLRRLLEGDAPDAIRLQASKAILSGLIDVQTHAEMNARIAELEKRVGPAHPGSERIS